MKTLTFKSSLLIAAMTQVAVSAAAQTQPAFNAVCNGLVQVDNDLYLVDPTGASLNRFTTDGLLKNSVSLAPDGTKVAFIPDATPNTFAVVDRSGRETSYSALKSDRDEESDDPDELSGLSAAPMIGVAWANGDTVRLDKHIGSNADLFEFYKVPADLSSKSHYAARPALGTTCIMRPSGGNVACLQDHDVLIGGRIVYSNSDLAKATVLGSLTLLVGNSAPVQNVGLQVQVTSILTGVTLPTGNWIESRVDPGDFLPVELEDQTVGFFPTVVVFLSCWHFSPSMAAQALRYRDR